MDGKKRSIEKYVHILRGAMKGREDLFRKGHLSLFFMIGCEGMGVFLYGNTSKVLHYSALFPFAQLDRFIIRLRLGYLGPLEERYMIQEQIKASPIDTLRACSGLS